jgi:hypothetical protein
MFRSLAPTMNSMIGRMMFDENVDIYIPRADGDYELAWNTPCNVQSTPLHSSVEDRSVAQSDDVKYIYMFIPSDVLIAPGYRVSWGGRMWNVGAENIERTAKGLTKLILTDWQIAVDPEILTIYRVRSSVRTLVGEFEVQITLNDFSTLASAGRRAYDGDTAMGEIDTGVIVGGPELGVVLVGDWFMRENLPGRITSLLYADLERVRLTFSLDRESR